MAKGTIKKIVQERGFGFIKAASGPDVFFHASVVPDGGFDNLQLGQAIEFELDGANASKGPRARWVVASQDRRRVA